MRRLPRDHGNSSIATFGLFFVFVCGQSVMGLLDYNSTQQEHGRQPVSYVQYLGSGDFREADFENWESEFLQMGALRGAYRVPVPEGFAGIQASRREPPHGRSSREANHRADAPGRSQGAWPSRSTSNSLEPRFPALVPVLLRDPRCRAARASTTSSSLLTAGRAVSGSVPRHAALLVRVVPELAERVPGDRGDGRAVHLPAPERLARVQARRRPAPQTST